MNKNNKVHEYVVSGLLDFNLFIAVAVNLIHSVSFPLMKPEFIQLN